MQVLIHIVLPVLLIMLGITLISLDLALSQEELWLFAPGFLVIVVGTILFRRKRKKEQKN